MEQEKPDGLARVLEMVKQAGGPKPIVFPAAARERAANEPPAQPSAVADVLAFPTKGDAAAALADDPMDVLATLQRAWERATKPREKIALADLIPSLVEDMRNMLAVNADLLVSQYQMTAALKAAQDELAAAQSALLKEGVRGGELLAANVELRDENMRIGTRAGAAVERLRFHQNDATAVRGEVRKLRGALEAISQPGLLDALPAVKALKDIARGAIGRPA